MLRIEGLNKSFGGVQATSDVSMHFPPKSLTAVIGPNGAGKTTFFNLVSGAIRPDSGRIFLDGENIAGQPAKVIVRKGLGRAFQVAQLFPTLTVEQTLSGALLSMMGQSSRMFGAFPPPAVRDKVYAVMEQLQLVSKAKVVSGQLSHGDQKLLDIALALALEPKVLLLDEPIAGMGPEERQRMIDTVYHLWETSDLTVVLIEHDMEIVFRVSQNIYVLSYGKVLAYGTPDDIRNNPDVIESYLGQPKEVVA